MRHYTEPSSCGDRPYPGEASRSRSSRNKTRQEERPERVVSGRQKWSKRYASFLIYALFSSHNFAYIQRYRNTAGWRIISERQSPESRPRGFTGGLTALDPFWPASDGRYRRADGGSRDGPYNSAPFGQKPFKTLSNIGLQV